MTLNVIVNNMIGVDSEVGLGQARSSDDAEKSILLKADDYHGVLVGNGSGVVVTDAMDFVGNSNAATFQGLIDELERDQQVKHEIRYQRQLGQIQTGIETKYRMISDPAKREELTSREFSQAVDQFNGQVRDAVRHGVGSLHILGYDKKAQSFSKFQLPDHRGAVMGKLDIVSAFADGTGGDLAGAYLATQVSGMDWDQIKPEQTFYFISLACAAATANAGVGGFMSIAEVTKDGVSYIDPIQVNAAVRVASKQIAGVIGKGEAMDMVADLYSGKSNYKNIAMELDITESDLKYAPTHLHQDVSKFNRQMAVNGKTEPEA
ncbi:MAG: hypothetical protein CMH61_02225 [Nanoarchaeota archaeon]|nr:hypothetical protein [Nanoarchaeota archaeon]|tara:strand:+ start:788 stop:1747 length:960 start_codon:yes stop_codon:yes gene_type:complete